MNHVTYPLSFADISIFHRKSADFAISRNTDIDCILIHNFLILLSFIESWKIVLVNMVIILMMSAKMATPGFRKIKVFWKKGYDVIIFTNGVPNKTLLRDTKLYCRCGYVTKVG